MSLVELLVAFAISSVILAGLTYMMVTSLKLYGRTNANVDAQNEAQTALNLVVDSVMSAKGVCMAETDPARVTSYPDEIVCALFGDLKIHDDNTMEFTGDAIMWHPALQEMYLVSGTYGLGTCTSKAAAPVEAIQAMRSSILPASREDRLPYLMAQHVTMFDIKVAESCFDVAEPDATPTPTPEGVSSEKFYFHNPLTVEIDMEFEVTYQSDKKATKTISDSVGVRNRLNYVYVQRVGDAMVKYLRK